MKPSFVHSILNFLATAYSNQMSLIRLGYIANFRIWRKRYPIRTHEVQRIQLEKLVCH